MSVLVPIIFIVSLFCLGINIWNLRSLKNSYAYIYWVIYVILPTIILAESQSKMEDSPEGALYIISFILSIIVIIGNVISFPDFSRWYAKRRTQRTGRYNPIQPNPIQSKTELRY